MNAPGDWIEALEALAQSESKTYEIRGTLSIWDEPKKSMNTPAQVKSAMPVLRRPCEGGFRVRRGDGLYFDHYDPREESILWTDSPIQAGRFPTAQFTHEQIIEAFAWILAVDVTTEDAD